eukprot:PhM_4_TR13951/c2_g1_i2/m.32160
MTGTSTEYFRTLYRFGVHPTATRALMLLRINKHLVASRRQGQEVRAPENDYILCDFTTEAVLSFCVDKTQVLVVDVTDVIVDIITDCSHAQTCLVVDDSGPDKDVVAVSEWSDTSPPEHFIFGSMRCRRAMDWLSLWHKHKQGISLDMHDVEMNDLDYLNYVIVNKTRRNVRDVLLELTLPSTIINVSSSRICNEFLCNCTRLQYLGLASLTSVTQIGDGFLCLCSSLTSLDLSSLANVRKMTCRHSQT